MHDPGAKYGPNLNLNWKLVWQLAAPPSPWGERRLILQLIFFGSPKRANVTQSLWRLQTLFVVGLFRFQLAII